MISGMISMITSMNTSMITGMNTSMNTSMIIPNTAKPEGTSVFPFFSELSSVHVCLVLICRSPSVFIILRDSKGDKTSKWIRPHPASFLIWHLYLTSSLPTTGSLLGIDPRHPSVSDPAPNHPFFQLSSERVSSDIFTTHWKTTTGSLWGIDPRHPRVSDHAPSFRRCLTNAQQRHPNVSRPARFFSAPSDFVLIWVSTPPSCQWQCVIAETSLGINYIIWSWRLGYRQRFF